MQKRPVLSRAAAFIHFYGNHFTYSLLAPQSPPHLHPYIHPYLHPYTFPSYTPTYTPTYIPYTHPYTYPTHTLHTPYTHHTHTLHTPHTHPTHILYTPYTHPTHTKYKIAGNIKSEMSVVQRRGPQSRLQRYTPLHNAEPILRYKQRNTRAAPIDTSPDIAMIVVPAWCSRDRTKRVMASLLLQVVSHFGGSSARLPTGCTAGHSERPGPHTARHSGARASEPARGSVSPSTPTGRAGPVVRNATGSAAAQRAQFLV